MQQLGCGYTASYLLALEGDERLRIDCERLLTVSISRFFRDIGLWRELEDRIFPRLIEKNRERIKVWSAGCACGEEVYSIRMLWEGLKGRFPRLPALDLLATDKNPVYLDRAKAGLYPASSLREVPESFRSRYFETRREGTHFIVTSSLKKDISWMEHDLLTDPPDRGFHLILLRNNLLTYYEDQLKGPAIQRVVRVLDDNGFLVIGSHEKLPMRLPELIIFDRSGSIFQKVKKHQVEFSC